MGEHPGHGLSHLIDQPLVENHVARDPPESVAFRYETLKNGRGNEQLGKDRNWEMFPLAIGAIHRALVIFWNSFPIRRIRSFVG